MNLHQNKDGPPPQLNQAIVASLITHSHYINGGKTVKMQEVNNKLQIIAKITQQDSVFKSLWYEWAAGLLYRGAALFEILLFSLLIILSIKRKDSINSKDHCCEHPFLRCQKQKQTRNKTMAPKLYEKPLYKEIPSCKTCVHLEQTEMRWESVKEGKMYHWNVFWSVVQFFMSL